MKKNNLSPWKWLICLVGFINSPATFAHTDMVWPKQSIKIVVSFTSGGAPDLLARILAAKWQESLGISVIVDNKPGAGGNIGADYVAKSPPDGYTLFIATVGTQTINPFLYKNLPFDANKDFSSISYLAGTPNLLVVNKNLPVHNVKELITYAKSRPGELSFGSSGSGTSIHLSGELFKTMAGVEMIHIPYKGRAQAIPDLLAGRVNMSFDNMPSVLPLVRAGELRAIAVTSAKRSPSAPDIPTISESGLPGFEATSWFALMGPANIPKPILHKINQETNRIMKLPEVREQLFKIGLETNPGSPEDLNQLIRKDSKKWSKIIHDSGVSLE